MRITVLAVPPLVNSIHASLRLNEKQVGALIGLPTLLFSVAAVGGALLISRVGARRAVVGGLLITAIAGALRGLGPSVLVLFSFTLVMGIGISLVQPAFPTLVRLWAPSQIGRATAVYSTGLLVGEGVPPAVGLVLPGGSSWAADLALWSIPVFAGAVLIAVLTRGDREAADGIPRRWWPDWRSGRTWRLGFMLGADSALYWSCNAFIPQYLQHTGRGGLVAAALTALNVGQIPAGLAIAALPPDLLSKRWLYWGAGPLAGAGVLGFVAGPGAVPVAAAAALGFLSAWVFVLALALPPLLAAPADVPRLAAAMFTITYVCSFSAPVLGGAAWDISGYAPLAFGPGLVACGLVTAMAAGLHLPHRRPQLTPLPA